MSFIKIRLYVVELFAKILLGKWAHPLKRTIESIAVTRPDIVNRSKKIRDANIVRYNYPARFDSFFIRCRVFPDRYLFELKEAILIKQRGVILTADKMILQESAGTVRRLLRRDDIRTYIHQNPINLPLDTPCYYLPVKPFYHFLGEEVPALLYALENMKDMTLITVSRNEQPKYYQNLLQFLFGNGDQLRIKVIRSNVKVQRLVLIQRDDSTRRMHPQDIEILNRYFTPKINAQKKLKRIYISRRKTLNRKIENENEIEHHLTKKGFQVIFLEDYSLEEQIRITKNCEFIVSPHGAGLTHLIWNPSLKKTILEIFPSYVKNDCYAGAANVLGYRYDYLICKQTKAGEICDVKQLDKKLAELNLN